MRNKLVPLVLIPIGDVSDEIATYSLKLPELWKLKLNNLYKQVIDKEKATIPIKSLNAVVEGLFPSVLKTQPKAFQDNSNWIISNSKINVEKILDVIKAWYLEEFINKASSIELKTTLREESKIFDKAQLTWEKTSVKMTQWKTYENDTVNLENEYFAAIPDYLCSEIANKRIPIKLAGEDIYFKKCKNELISWPPRNCRTEKNCKDNYYSIVIEISVKTQAFCSYPLIFLKPKVRRWVTGKVADYLPKNEAVTVFMSYKPYWFYEERTADMVTARIKFDKNKGSFDWLDNIKKIFNRFNFHISIPEAEKLKSDSATYLKEDNDVNCAIVYSPKINSSHDVMSGVGMVDRMEILSQFTNIFPNLKQYNQLHNISNVNKRVQTNALREPVNKNLGENIRKSLAGIAGKEITIEIMYQESIMLEKMVHGIEKIFAVTNGKGSNRHYLTDEITLKIMPIRLGALGEKLEPKDGYRQRIREVENNLTKPSGVTGTIVELPTKGWKGNEDPKNAIRKGLYKSGRVNQFITPIDETSEDSGLEHRIENAVLDLLRQFGYMPNCLDFSTLKSIPRELDIYGLWLVRKKNEKRNKNSSKIHYPIIVKLSTTNNEIWVKTPSSNGWKTYYDAIVSIGGHSLDDSFSGAMSKEHLHGFVNRFLNEIENRNAILIFDGVNARNDFTVLTDKNLKENSFSVTDSNKKGRNAYPNLRIVRVKTGSEVPDYYGQNNVGEVRFVSGVKKVSGKVYYSISKKSTTLKKVNPNVSRIAKPLGDLKFPSILEIVPFFLQESDLVDDYVYAIHAMRDMYPIYDDETIHPLPLHLCKKLAESLENK